MEIAYIGPRTANWELFSYKQCHANALFIKIIDKDGVDTGTFKILNQSLLDYLFIR